MNQKKQGTVRRILNIRGMGGALTAFAGLIIIYIAFGIINPKVFAGQNVMNLLRSMSKYLIIGIGQSYVLITGNIDLSIGSVVGMSAMTSAALMCMGMNPALAILITLVCCMAVGVVNGFLVGKCKLPPFIATLGTMKIFRSVTQQMTQTFNPSVPAGFKTIASARIGNQIILPILYWVIMVVIMHIIFRKTAFGRQTIAIGSNEKAAKLSGINVAWVKMKVYALGGVMCAIGAIIYIARIGSMDFANAGSGYEMDAIAAVVVGGTSMAGGKGSLVGAFVGMLIIGVMNNILNTVGVPTFLCEAVKGLIIIFAVLLQKKDSN